MPPRVIENVDQLKQLAGQEIGVSDWLEVTQDQINAFADATGDHQWIHVDPERAAKESPFRNTIAHGFLTLSLLPKLWSQVVSLRDGFKIVINYGLNRMRFPAAVPSASRIRGRFLVKDVEGLDGAVQVVLTVTVEVEGSEKPCLAAEWVLRAYR